MAFILEVPFEDRQIVSKYGAVWNKSRGAWVYPNSTLPVQLKSYLPKKYSWMDYQMNSGRGNLNPIKETGNIALRRDQKDDVNALLAAFNVNAPEVLIASKTGTGKTFVALVLAMMLPNSGKILIVSPKSVIPSWRESILDVGDQGKRFVLINYESLKKLIKAPKQPSRNTKKAKTKAGERNRKHRLNIAHVSSGTPYVAWDVIIFDEAHYIDNLDSQRSKAAETIVSGSPNARIIKVSATIGKNPIKLANLARGFAWRTGKEIPTSLPSHEEWYEWCQSKGISAEWKIWGKQKTLSWIPNDHDLKLINYLLFEGNPTWAVRTDPGWDSTQRYQIPIELDKVEKEAYEQAWDEFQKIVKQLDKLKKSGQNINHREAKQKGLAALIRYRQKAGQLKAPYIAEYVKDLLEGDVQVAISAEFLSTVDALLDHLKGIDVALYTGRNESTREEERVAYQTGEKRVIIFTPSEGFNLHQGDRYGNMVPRIQICAEPSWDPIKGLQKEGRSNRDGFTAPVIYPSAIDTIDYDIIKTLIQGYKSIETMMGDETNAMKLVSRITGFDPNEW